MRLLSRDHCVVSGRDDLEHLFTFEEFPVHMGCVGHPRNQDLCAPMSWWISRSTGSLQLNPLIPLEVLYGASHGSGSIGGLWRRHHEAFAAFVCEGTPSRVLEIGGGHGVLAHACVRRCPDLHWAIVEPNPTLQPHPRITVHRGLFDGGFDLPDGVDTVVHSHVLEHIYEPLEFMSQIARGLGRGRRQAFSVPNLGVMLDRKYTNCINFEHTVLLTEPFIEYILRRSGFLVERKAYFKDDHSIFYCVVRGDADASVPLPDEHDHHRRAYGDYIRHHQEIIRDLNRRMATHGEQVYLFGGHVFAQYLLAFGLEASRIRCILDNDPNKQGRRLYGSDLMVHSPTVLRDASNPVVILRAGVYNAEIREDIEHNINAGTVFWE